MRILLTGASSFTGYWFANALLLAGHHVVLSYRGHQCDYGGIRGQRIAALSARAETAWGITFGSGEFLDLAGSQDFDLLCHHAAEMTDYRSWDFDALEASRRNTANLRQVLSKLARRGCHRLIATGSVFEPYEGLGGDDRAFNPYGLSKHLSFETIRMEAEHQDWTVGKFVIPNPFGPLEEARFTAYLAKNWLAGKVPSVQTPEYVRDNIPVSLLALDYAGFCAGPAVRRAAPSGYIESQGAFAHRVAREFSARTGLACDLTLSQQVEFSEPLVRVNPAQSLSRHPTWDEVAAWDAFVRYYQMAG